VESGYSDTGPGIPEKFLPFIFTRFFRAPDLSLNTHGSGLGLSICKQIIESHDGEIKAFSPEGSGLVFQISLPLNMVERENDHTEGYL